MKNGFTFVDLFSGIGGFKIGVEQNGGRSVGFSEINKDAISAYCENFQEDIDSNFGDITKIKSLPDHDLLTAGVPCQSWSIAGRNLGFDDDRGQLWNDTIYLLKKSKPKAFIFENVKGLSDPRNKEALLYIMKRIEGAGYHADYFIINSKEYGIPQSRVRVYIVGFLNVENFKKFTLPKKVANKGIHHFLQSDINNNNTKSSISIEKKTTSLSSKNGINDYFLFNDLRNGATTIHSWDLISTSKKQKEICLILLKNRRKKAYGHLDGNPLSLSHFKNIDSSITKRSLDSLVNKKILKEEKYLFSVLPYDKSKLNQSEALILKLAKEGLLNIDQVKTDRGLKRKRIKILDIIKDLEINEVLTCVEVRYDFKNTKISTGLFGINRIFMPSSDIFPTLVASDTNDYIALNNVDKLDIDSYRNNFLTQIFHQKKYRKITKEEACAIQGFPTNFSLPEKRARWMKLIGNSVSTPVIHHLCSSIINTGAFK
jgi:DNA (cytosine-5)-methyltransferase 1